jgi:hypothetical protein
MKRGLRIFLVFILSAFMLWGQTFASEVDNEELIICPLYHAKTLKPKLSQNTTDKFKHCALSCQLALRCSSMDTLSLGILKELWDLISPGNAEWEDLVADVMGINFATNGEATNDKECNYQCKKIYENFYREEYR